MLLLLIFVSSCVLQMAVIDKVRVSFMLPVIFELCITLHYAYLKYLGM